MPDDTSKEKAVFTTNEGRLLPVLYADSLVANSRKDGFHLLQVLVNLPDGLHEQARVMILDAHLRRFIESLCVHCDYYPERPPSVPPEEKPAAAAT